MNDLDYQLRFVIGSAWRLLSLQDNTVGSPSHGCFHYAYWRDKTSEFPDARFQEAGAALGLLSMPDFDWARRELGLAGGEQTYAAFSAALKNWSRQQYPEGCWDEWYKGERGFAATEFTMIAYGLAARFLGDALSEDDRRLLCDTMAKAAGWLAGRDDRVKANHQAAGAAAMALAWDLTGNARFKSAARRMAADTLARQQPEGWFPEIGGMDLGYCSVLLDYMMIYSWVANDETVIEPMLRLFDFMFPHLHPDATISPEAGLCLNPYVSRLGTGLLAAYSPKAASVMSHLAAASPERDGLTPYLADDLRLCRWSYLPIVSWLLRDRFATAPEAEDLGSIFPSGWTVSHDAAIAAFHDGERHIYVSAAGGGAVRVFIGTEMIFTDAGIDLTGIDGEMVHCGYDRSRNIGVFDTGIRFEVSYGRPSFVFPGFLSRLILRLGCVTPLTSRLMRRAIDWRRIRSGTAVNQSSAPVAGGASAHSLTRSVQVRGKIIEIRDTIQSTAEKFSSENLRHNISFQDTCPVIEGDFSAARRVEVMKTIDLSGQAPVFKSQVSAS